MNVRCINELLVRISFWMSCQKSSFIETLIILKEWLVEKEDTNGEILDFVSGCSWPEPAPALSSKYLCHFQL